MNCYMTLNDLGMLLSDNRLSLALAAHLLALLLALLRFLQSRERQIQCLVASGWIPHPAPEEYDDRRFQWEITSEPVVYEVGTHIDKIHRMCKVPRHTRAAAYRVFKGLRAAGVCCQVMAVTKRQEGFPVNHCECGWQVTLVAPAPEQAV